MESPSEIQELGAVHDIVVDTCTGPMSTVRSLHGIGATGSKDKVKGRRELGRCKKTGRLCHGSATWCEAFQMEMQRPNSNCLHFESRDVKLRKRKERLYET